MKTILKLTLFFYFLISVFSNAISNENFFDKGLKLYKDKKYDDARFMFEKSIVFNPKNSTSYLYLAKIYNAEENQKKEEKNLDAVLLIEPNNEEAILMSMKIALEKSNILFRVSKIPLLSSHNTLQTLVNFFDKSFTFK